MLLWGFKTEAAFDVWSLEHFLNGISIAAFADLGFTRLMLWTRLGKKGFTEEQKGIVIFILVLAVSLFWENAEHYIEAGILPGAIGARITYWFQGVEHWSNRLIADTLMVLLGWYVYTKKKNFAWAAKILSTLWLLVHIVVFPHSMYLHTLFGPPAP